LISIIDSLIETETYYNTMNTKNHVFLICICILFTACYSSGNNTVIEQNLIHSIDANITSFNKGNGAMLTLLNNDLSDRHIGDRAAIWQPRATQVQILSDNLFAYVESLKLELKQKANLKIVSSKEGFAKNESFDMPDKNAVVAIFKENGKGIELYDKIKNYESAVLNVDSTIKNEFVNTLSIIPSYTIATDNKKQDFLQTYFLNTSAIEVIAFLTYIQNQVRQSESKIINFCYLQVAPQGGCDFARRVQILTSQSTTYIKPGGTIKITAGMGAYTTNASPVIIIDGEKASFNQDGSASYTIVGANKPGKYTVPVKVDFFDEHNIKESMLVYVKYEVGK
jgi:hypothetical protein